MAHRGCLLMLIFDEALHTPSLVQHTTDNDVHAYGFGGITWVPVSTSMDKYLNSSCSMLYGDT